MTEKQVNLKNSIIIKMTADYERRSARSIRMNKELPSNVLILKKCIETEWNDSNIQALFFINSHDDSYTVEECNHHMKINNFNFLI